MACSSHQSCTMPPRRRRQQRKTTVLTASLVTFSAVSRQVNAANQTLTPEVIAKRTKRHLDELEVMIHLVDSGVY